MESRGRARVAEREVACSGEKSYQRGARVQTLTATASAESVIKGHNITRTSHNTRTMDGSSLACKHAVPAVEPVRLPTTLP